MADKIPYAMEKTTTYENFIAVCPVCGYRNIYNRVSDLRTETPIAFRQVECLNEECRKPFNINGDQMDSAFSMLIFDCYELRKAKHYCYCILNLSQAFEVFVSHYLHVELLYKPFWREGRHDLERFNQLAEDLYKTVRRFTFAQLRGIFLNHALESRKFRSLDDSEDAIRKIPELTMTPPDSRFKTVGNAQLRDLLLRLKQTKINELRNRVVHKHAYRPNREEVDRAIEETRAILLPLAQLLRINAVGIDGYAKEDR